MPIPHSLAFIAVKKDGADVNKLYNVMITHLTGTCHKKVKFVLKLKIVNILVDVFNVLLLCFSILATTCLNCSSSVTLELESHVFC